MRSDVGGGGKDYGEVGGEVAKGGGEVGVAEDGTVE